ncbi:uncharacterized protein [Haliotis asinina]|uniref:uncharacterized protein n=1 Tax=Haliotis asinina TaxID=109174 RepID=UPI0035318209
MLLLICLAFIGLSAGQGNDQYARIFEQDVDTNNNKIADLSEFQAIFDKYDLNKDGQVPKAEYMQATGDSGQAASIFFDFLDPNKDGVIHRSELPSIFHVFDFNDDGKVTEAEFTKHYSEMKMMIMFIQGLGK